MCASRYKPLSERRRLISHSSLSIEQILAILADTPPRIAELTAGLTETQLHAVPRPAEWSANEVLAHLRSCADVWGNCITTILHQDKPTIRTVNPTTWIKSTNYLEQEFRSSLQAFTSQRTKLLDLLKSLPPKAWSRSATVTGAGNPLVWTVQSYAHRMARHERPHWKQIQHIVEALGAHR